MLNEAAAKKISRLVLIALGSKFDGEVLAAMTAMRKQLAAERLSFHDVAAAIEGNNGNRVVGFSRAEEPAIFARGVAKGRADEARRQRMPPDVCDDDGEPLWNEMARFCQQNTGA